jgi:phospholipase C
MRKNRGLSRRELLQATGATIGLAAVGCGDSKPDPKGDPTLLDQIDTFVVLCMENRSFDHYLGSRSLLEGLAVDGLTGVETNPAPDGSTVPSFQMDEFITADIDHSWEACHAQWNHGLNDGFVKAHAGPNQNDPMGYHIREQLPTTYQLADAFSVCDRWFASVMGPTWPNRFYLHGATSMGVQTNDRISNFPNIFDALRNSGVTSTNFFHDLPWASGGYLKTEGLATIENFFTQAKSGTLPQYSLLDPHFLGVGANDDHPDHDPHLGQALIASVYAALAQSPQWDRCLFILTYDEHGGFFDHVHPGLTTDENVDFQQLGFRVPSIVAGPMVRPGATISTVFDHTSVLSTLSRRFKLSEINERVNNAADVSTCLEASTTARKAPQLDPVEVSLSALRDRPVKTGHHEELVAAADAGIIPKHLDRRSESLEIAQRVLRFGEALGAVKLVY